MEVTVVDERDSSWEKHAHRFRVYLFSGVGRPGQGFNTETFDVTDATLLEVIEWAEHRAGADRMFAVALVENHPRRGRGLNWLIGSDANSVPIDAAEDALLRQMRTRRRR